MLAFFMGQFYVLIIGQFVSILEPEQRVNYVTQSHHSKKGHSLIQTQWKREIRGNVKVEGPTEDT